MRRFRLSLLLLVFVTTLVGCGGGEPTVVMPTETYQPTEIERENAEREAAEREQENR